VMPRQKRIGVGYNELGIKKVVKGGDVWIPRKERKKSGRRQGIPNASSGKCRQKRRKRNCAMRWTMTTIPDCPRWMSTSTSKNRKPTANKAQKKPPAMREGNNWHPGRESNPYLQLRRLGGYLHISMKSQML